MILLLAAAAAAAAAIASTPIAELSGGDEARFTACAALVKTDAEKAIEEADGWAKRTNGVPARHCLGLAYAAAGRWEPAALAFDQAATGARDTGDGRAAALWTQAGNAALAGEDPAQARTYLDRALALSTLSDVMRGEALLDRARADVALGDLPAGRADLDKGLKFADADPYAWLLSATLARREGNVARAAKDIETAAKLAPDDAGVALEAGNVALASGAPAAAETAWRRAVELAPNEPEGRAAAAALASGGIVVTPRQAPPGR